MTLLAKLLAPGWPQLRSRLPFGPRSQASLQKAQQTEDPSGCGAASPSQGRWDPDSLRPALRLGGQATAWEGSPGSASTATV